VWASEAQKSCPVHKISMSGALASTDKLIKKMRRPAEGLPLQRQNAREYYKKARLFLRMPSGHLKHKNAI
jgi:hypothetical protein